MRKVFETIEIKIINEPIERPAGRQLTFLRDIVENIFNKKIKMMKLKKQRNHIKKTFISFLIAVFLLVQGVFPINVVAQIAPDAPAAPSAPTPPPQPEATVTSSPEPTPPAQPTPPPQPTPPSAPTAPSAPTLEEATLTPSPTPTLDTNSSTQGNTSSSGTSSSSVSGNTSSQPSLWKGTGAQTQNGQTGATIVNTGDANNVGNISTSANTNVSVSPIVSGSGGGITVVNSENGADSNNVGSVDSDQNTNTIQDNSASVGSNLYQKTITGDNSASKNTGGDNTITTGDANTTGTILTGVNTNLDGVLVYEFNIVDDHIGDYVLDFSNASCIFGCTSSSTTVVNSGNGAGSTNTGSVDSDINNNTFQTNDATIINNMTLISDSGDNKADMNTGGDNSITTGDANVSGSVVNMVNNNIVGNVVYAVVNIFGDLVGDIILPDGSVLSCCVGDVSAANTGNGAGSTNTANVDQTSNNEIYQFNNVDIQNNLTFDAETGKNDVNKNTDGNNSITTGDTNLVAQVLNVANINIVGGNWWLVLVNEAGRWIGKIIGADGANYAGSEGFEFIVNEFGEITVVNSGNAVGSTNTASVNQTTNTTITQTNNASIVNNIDLSAYTGRNSANMNTGGNSSITTGDANIIASIVNFVNNNIVSGGKLFVTVINVFGSWLGDFVGPGQTKDNKVADNGIGGAAVDNAANISDSNNGLTNSGEQGNNLSSTENMEASFFKISPKKKVMGLFASSNMSNDENSEVALTNEGQTSQETAARKVVRINLAWLILILPIGATYVFRKRRLALKTSVQKD